MRTREEIMADMLLAFIHYSEYHEVITEELRRRLTVPQYFTCNDFAHFDLQCCTICHTSYPHYDMWDVTLCDDSHAWVCQPLVFLLMRQIHIRGSSKEEKLLTEILGPEPEDKHSDALTAAYSDAVTDDEKLLCCLRYLHHDYGRLAKDSSRSAEEIVANAKNETGNPLLSKPARYARVAGGREGNLEEPD
jgi:hypothetical protein